MVGGKGASTEREAHLIRARLDHPVLHSWLGRLPARARGRAANVAIARCRESGVVTGDAECMRTAAQGQARSTPARPPPRAYRHPEPSIVQHHLLLLEGNRFHLIGPPHIDQNRATGSG